MTPLALSRFNTVAIISAVGLVVGHWLQPVVVVVIWRRAIPFLLVIAMLGALRGWREAVVREPPAEGTRTIILAGAFSVGSVFLVTLGYVAFHGFPGG